MAKGKKARPDGALKEIKNIVRTMYLYQGFSIRKIAAKFNADQEYVRKYGSVSVSSVATYCKEARIEAEQWIDEDALEKYTGEFVRKQHTIDEEIEKLRTLQEMLDLTDEKDKELYLKLSNAMHQMSMNQIKMMSDIELVMQVNRFNKERRLKNDTLVMLDEDGKKIDTAKKRGYKTLKSVNEENDQNTESYVQGLSEDKETEQYSDSGSVDDGNSRDLSGISDN